MGFPEPPASPHAQPPALRLLERPRPPRPAQPPPTSWTARVQQWFDRWLAT